MPTLATNKQAKFEYEILERVEAGIVLTGAEVKSVKNGGLKLTDAFVTFKGENAYLTNAHIARYNKTNSALPYDPTHSRRLLLHKKEINQLIGKKSQEGLTIVPLSAYTSKDLIKIELALVRGKKQHDKRETIRTREVERDIRRALKRG